MLFYSSYQITFLSKLYLFIAWQTFSFILSYSIFLNIFIVIYIIFFILCFTICCRMIIFISFVVFKNNETILWIFRSENFERWAFYGVNGNTFAEYKISWVRFSAEAKILLMGFFVLHIILIHNMKFYMITFYNVKKCETNLNFVLFCFWFWVRFSDIWLVNAINGNIIFFIKKSFNCLFFIFSKLSKLKS